ncbi:50S ribosomal protein L30 [Candidatus Woesearchaeota archaeon]|nr:50S ribosomal protein L30 [Candidatus Woesearchaeota archaeon]
MKKRVAVIRLRGDIGLTKEIKDTLKLLRLYKKNTCVIIPNSVEYSGMLLKVKDNVTWGEIDGTIFKTLLMKRGKVVGNAGLTENYLKDKTKIDSDTFAKEFMEFKKELSEVPGLKPFFRLSPPRGGFETKGVKVPFSLGGSLGYRKDKINELILKMI